MHKQKIRMQQALTTALMSKSRRNKVGAILIKNKHIIAEGYNGTIKGQCPDILEYYLPHGSLPTPELNNIDILEHIDCPSCNGLGVIPSDTTYADIRKCKVCNGKRKIDIYNKTNPSTFHAEANLLLFCARNGISTAGADIYITLSPCIDCAKLLIQAGIKRVYYKETYRSTDGLYFLEENHVSTIKV